MKKNRNRLLALIAFLVFIGSSLRVSAAPLYGGEAVALRGGRASLNAASSDAETPASQGIEGFWKLTEVRGGNSPTAKETVQNYEKAGMLVCIEIRRDGTLLFDNFGRQTEGTWDQDAVVLGSGNLSYTLQDDVLALDNGPGGEMVFERTTEEVIDSLKGYKKGVLDEKVTYSEEEETIMDTDYASVTITGYKADKTGFTVNFRCRNKTDSQLMIDADKAIFNKYEINPVWAIALKPGETVEKQLNIKPVKFESCGITSIDELILRLKTIDSGNYKTLGEETAFVYPTGKKAEDIKVPERIPVEGELIAMDNDDCTFIIQGVDPSASTGYALNYYYENKSDRTLTLLNKNSMVNDQGVSCIMAEELLPGTRIYGSGFFTKTALEKAGLSIEDIKKISATVYVLEKNEKGAANTIAEEDFTYEP